MGSEYEEGVLSIIRGSKGWNEKYKSISEFKYHLEGAHLAHQELTSAGVWVFWRENERQEQILTLLQNFDCGYGCLLQYWGVVKVEGRNHYLSTSNYPFSVSGLKKGNCWYRKLCRDHVYVVDIDDNDQKQLQLIGGVGRAYRKKYPESTPDLRLYSTDEFPMRDQAARCGFRGYLALPLFHSHTNQCYAVLELLSEYNTISRHLLSSLDKALQIAGLWSTHSSISISGFARKMKKPETEIREILELAMETVPRLYLALVWIPCKQCCVNKINTNLHCMQINSFISSQNKMVNSLLGVHFDDMVNYLEACEFHNLQIDVSSCLDSRISKNPLAHYAQKARISHSFAVYLTKVNNNNQRYVLQFFHQDAYGDYSLHLLKRIMEMNLRTFRFVSRGSLVSESQNSHSIVSLNVIKSYKQELALWDFRTYTERDDSCCLQPSPKDDSQRWVFRINSNSLLVPKTLIKEKIEDFMKDIQVDWTPVDTADIDYWIIQFWEPKMVENRCYLQALDQPYAVSCLARGLATFRKKCTTHSYFVDDEAKKEELGPPGRVFRNGLPEISPDVFHYTTKEYPIINYARHCCRLFYRGYLALPIFEDEHNHKCIGMLEFLGFSPLALTNIRSALEAAKLCSTHTDLYPRYLADEQPVNIIYGKEEALTEVRNALELIYNIPQLYMANMRLIGFTYKPEKGWLGWHWHLKPNHVLCFCRNLCEIYVKNPSLFQRKSGRNSQSTHHAIIVEEEAEKVMIKVKSEEDIIKFLCLSLGLAKLNEEVGTRLNLEKGAFKLKYPDEDGDEVLLTNDADLQLCRKTQITMNKTYIQLFVR